MSKKYKNGLILGKFYPPHKGHLYLIDEGLKYSEHLYLLVCSLKSETIPGELRYEWLKEIYSSTPNITIIHCSEELPQEPSEHLDFWNIWCDVVHRYISIPLDVIFTSENYGEPFSQHLQISHHLVDLGRNTFSVSGTCIRNETLKYWYYIPDSIKYYFVKKIVLIGSESTGKSTLAKMLAEYYNTSYVEEYGRDYCKMKDGILGIYDFPQISKSRQELEDRKVREANKLLFIDTEDIVTYIFSKLYCPDEWEKTKEYFECKIKNNQYDLYILLRPDCEAVQDGTRTYLDYRWTQYLMEKEIVKQLGVPYFEVCSKTWQDRFESVKDKIKREFGI